MPGLFSRLASAGCCSVRWKLLAVGLGSGEVALHRLWAGPGTEPLRAISLREWGYEPEMTGSVSDLQWSPDSRALAVGTHLRTFTPSSIEKWSLEFTEAGSSLVLMVIHVPLWFPEARRLGTNRLLPQSTSLNVAL